MKKIYIYSMALLAVFGKLFFVIFGMLFITVLAVDALEYEVTGDCEQCLILHKISPGLAGQGEK